MTTSATSPMMAVAGTRESIFSRLAAGNTMPITIIVLVIVALWYGFTVYLNTPWQLSVYERGGIEWSATDLVRDTLEQDRPVLPSPHQVAA